VRPGRGLDEADLDPDPIVQFMRWMQDALDAGLRMPNEMTLATADRSGRVSARMVLLRGVDERGFRFFTNYQSRKARQLADNPRAALVFFWAALERQINVEGEVERVVAAESDDYWVTRPPGSRLGAWVSHQSEVIAGRGELDGALAEVAERYGGGDIPRPPFWGGYRVVPDMIEFWQGRPNRLHDRLSYRRARGAWVIERLAP
jgi:pyridoxamine 5'-phosphate oxidase